MGLSYLAWQDRKQLLSQWVQSNGNAQSIEADLVLTKSASAQHQSTRELLSVAEMQKRGLPMEKIRAVVSRGNGHPDPDCPGIASLTRFWVSTSTTQVDTDTTKQESTVRLQADAASTLNASFGLPPVSSAAMSSGGVQEILNGLTGAPAVPADSGPSVFATWGFPQYH